VSTACVVQFPHPGLEHRPPKGAAVFPWNLGRHGRKFLRALGRLLADDGALRHTDVVFWGEYEAASRVLCRWSPTGELPTALHEPLLTTPPDSPKRQNTDPWVFGDRFLYSNCKQLTPHGGASALQSLPRGSVILFGSQIGGQFCLDTVFVVAESLRYEVNDAADLPVDDAFRACTIESLAVYEHHAINLQAAQFTLHLGATNDNPVDGMFSFTPALPAGADGPRFARPAYHDRRFVNPESKQSPSGAKVRRPTDEVREAWEAAVLGCRRSGVDLAVHVDLPGSAGMTES
jgi:hypothetical protein